jgi:hypothetical protein
MANSTKKEDVGSQEKKIELGQLGISGTRQSRKNIKQMVEKTLKNYEDVNDIELI